ncbi:MAG: substrate-binding domain-containing protein [Thermoplasmata archaeon]|nr:substrate-binding domain-containing protein [Thermoplasmata archaeon]
MNGKRTAVAAVALALALCISVIAVFWQVSSNQPVLYLATTTSLHDSGLLSKLLPEFERASNTRVYVIAAGTGQALEYGKRGDADLLMVHAPEIEMEFMNAGHGVERKELFYSEFVIVGPKTNPAGISANDTITLAFWKIYNSGSKFVSRGDFSGTNLRELQIWTQLGISPQELKSRPWYLNGSGSMSTALMLANEKEAYTLGDLATWTFMKLKLRNLVKFEVEKTGELVNVYSLIITKSGFEKKGEPVVKFKTWLESRETLSEIENYTINSEQVFWVRW